jgi:hypothetical protein
MEKPTHQQVVEALHYDEETGFFSWANRRSSRVAKGSIAGCETKNGYIYIKINKVQIYAHRLAWFYVNGEWPCSEIDHIDGCRSNNSFSNLRLVSRAENTQNQVPYGRSSASGFLGVTLHKKTAKCQAQIRVGTKTTYLGLFANKLDAVRAYWDAKSKFHPTAPNRYMGAA